MNQMMNINWNRLRELLCVGSSSKTQRLKSELEAAGWEAVIAENASEVRRNLEETNYDLGLICLDDIQLAEDVLAMDESMHWIAIVSDETLTDEDAVRLIAGHFYDYHRFPVDTGRLLTTVGHASGIAQLRRLHSDGTNDELTDRFIGESEPMREIKRNVARVAQRNFSVVISGESGTGKELIARAIHDQSTRSDGPFVAVNCGSLPNSLIQSELFGHEKGAFTGADKRRLGRFEAASGGTLFLDEIGDLSFDVQANLLRVLEQGVIERVGDNESRTVDVRVVAATNVDLQAAVAESRFREDLYYRINVVQINVPPLRDRGDDLMRLAESFLAQFNDDRQAKSFSKRAITAMRTYTWPGNVRELINRIQQAQISCEGRIILPKDLGLESIEDEHVTTGPTLEDARNRAERSVLAGALWRNTNNISRVARELAVSRVTLYRLLKKHNIEQVKQRT